MTQPQPQPLIPRGAIVVATFVILGFLGWAVYNSDLKLAGVLMVPVLFVFGADLGSWIRSSRWGQPGAAPPPGPPPADAAVKPEGSA